MGLSLRSPPTGVEAPRGQESDLACSSLHVSAVLRTVPRMLEPLDHHLLDE